MLLLRKLKKPEGAGNRQRRNEDIYRLSSEAALRLSARVFGIPVLTTAICADARTASIRWPFLDHVLYTHTFFR